MCSLQISVMFGQIATVDENIIKNDAARVLCKQLFLNALEEFVGGIDAERHS